MNNAIVALTRGYAKNEGYKHLIQRNNAIKKFFGDKYPIVLFHEGNITEDQQRYIQRTSDMTIKFVDVSEVWVGGYESMCRFQSYWLWEYCKEYDYILRIDEDCWITKMETDPFEQIGDNVYLKSVYWAESHSETNATLPQAIAELTAYPAEEFYNNKFPYTNVSVSSVSFWRTPGMASKLKYLALSDAQLKNRWGDLPLLGSLLNIYAKGKVGTTKGLSYYHMSHNFNINAD